MDHLIMILSLKVSSWFYMGTIPVLFTAALTFLKVAYTMREPLPLPVERPRFALLPKYVVSIPIHSTENADEKLAADLAAFGFQRLQRDPRKLMFQRGSSLGDFSVKIAKVMVCSSRPVSNPIQLDVEYGLLFGCAFDTGDLWKFCCELRDKFGSSGDDGAPIESGNPYQSPQS